MKAIILESPKRNVPQKNAPSPRQVNAHEVAHLVECLYGNKIGYEPIADSPLLSALLHNQSEGSMATRPITCVPDEDDNQIAAHAASQKPLPPGNVKRLLSPASNKKPTSKPIEQHEVNINGVRYRQVNFVNIQYTVTNSQTHIKRGALVDRGANGGIAGSDIRLIASASMMPRRFTKSCVNMPLNLQRQQWMHHPSLHTLLLHNWEQGLGKAQHMHLFYTGKAKSLSTKL